MTWKYRIYCCAIIIIVISSYRFFEDLMVKIIW